jgi:hypothetical protein
MDLVVTGEVWHWRGPSPHHFVTVPPEESELISELAPRLSYGWGAIAVHGCVGDTEFTTSIFPKDGGYIVPLKAAVRRSEGIEIGDEVTIRLSLDLT